MNTNGIAHFAGRRLLGAGLKKCIWISRKNNTVVGKLQQKNASYRENSFLYIRKIVHIIDYVRFSVHIRFIKKNSHPIALGWLFCHCVLFYGQVTRDVVTVRVSPPLEFSAITVTLQ